MKEQIEALVAEWHAAAAIAGNRDVEACWRHCADRLDALLREDAGGWRPVRELPEELREGVALDFWSAAHVRQGQAPYPGGGWMLQYVAPGRHWRAISDAFVDAGITHFRFPSPPPEEPPR